MVRSRGRIVNGASGSSASSLWLEFSTLGIRNLIPGLPNDLACVCLACVPLWQHGRLRSVCRSWNAALSGDFIIQLRRKLGKGEEFLYLFRDDPSLCRGEVFDPRAQLWSTFSPMPCNPSRYSMSNFECVAAGQQLYVLGGSLFDARNFPMDRPVASSSVFKYDPVRSQWEQCQDMKTPRGSFACGIFQGCLIVAGGGSRHAQFRAGGDRICEAEKYDLARDSWESLPGLHSIRAGCSGFFVGDEFWVLGGYGEARTISGVLPVDEHYNDGEVFSFGSGSWRKLEAMWEDGERLRLGRIAVLYGDVDGLPSVFMLENSKLLRYDFGSNGWYPESELPSPLAAESSCRLVGLDGEVYVIPGGVNEQRYERSPRSWSRSTTRRCNILFQIYHPVKRTWRAVVTKPPLDHQHNPPWGAMCVMKL
ncbi:hypothetical protein SELMODRAFT_182085 [Selaginella moellendorffii]|uniref:F-box domain-containing protein n=1 Tax=Selaginella moellendorffii TaxID=88036 RepID=D8SRI8_SELML|nr:F-box/kelch-repeat protein OR23 [Selaginella moellendorffii]EFJ13150.1 hypothetical protein SELMODRAFT_182085 [Selaginella moellendorffii]|eukprot:XP_024515491.1 F-box/kelch-repeat protein OR23 [Selaginella moellendorffii]